MKNLQAARKAKGLTQQDLADFLGIGRVTYARYENGDRQPDYETLLKLANYLDVSTDYLLGRTDNPAMAQGAFDLAGNNSALTADEQAAVEAFLAMYRQNKEK